MTKISSFANVIQHYDAIFFDAFGVLKNYNGLIEGVAETIYKLHNSQKQIFILTNDSSRSPFELAKKYLNKVESKDVILNSSVISMKAVCESELENPGKAAKLFEKAALIGENDFSAMYLKKAGIHYESENEFKNALRCYETIKQKYSMTAEGSDIDKYIYKMKAALGEYNP